MQRLKQAASRQYVQGWGVESPSAADLTALCLQLTKQGKFGRDAFEA